MLWHNPPASALVHRPLPTSSRRSWRSLRGGFSKCPATVRKRIRVFHIPCKTPFCRKVHLPYAAPALPLRACRTPKQLSRKRAGTWCRSGFSGAQFRYEGSHWYSVWLCNSYQPRCCCSGCGFCQGCHPFCRKQNGDYPPVESQKLKGDSRHPGINSNPGHPAGGEKRRVAHLF